jgi:hypothetical protein
MDNAFPAIGILALVALFVAILLFRYSRAKSILEQWAATNEYEIVSSEHRWLGGPFLWGTSASQEVYYVTIRTPNGRIRKGWVRCGGWFWGFFSNQADVEWDE